MSEEKRIVDPMERAILKSFSIATSGDLKRKTITALVQIAMPSSSEAAIAKRIELLAKEKDYLMTSGRGYYKRNPKYNFVFAEDAVPGTLDKTTEIRKDELREHSLNLKDAIRTWAYQLSTEEPCTEHLLAGGVPSSEIILASQDHVLFSDLANHLPALGTAVLSDWDGYKRELEELDGLKTDLISCIENEIRKCFAGIDIVFAYSNDEEGRYYNCYLIQNIVYNIFVGLENGKKGSDDFMSAVEHLRDTPLQESKGYCYWGEYITLPAENRELLTEGIDRFMTFFETLGASEFSDKGRDIAVKVRSLKQKRNNICRELDRLLKYTSYPGECEYLKGF